MKKVLVVVLLFIALASHAQQSQPRWEADSLSNPQRIQNAERLMSQCSKLHSYTLAGEAGSVLFIGAAILFIPNGTSQQINGATITVYLSSGVMGCFLAGGICIVGALVCDIVSEVKSSHANFFLHEVTGTKKVSLYQGNNGMGIAFNF